MESETIYEQIDTQTMNKHFVLYPKCAIDFDIFSRRKYHLKIDNQNLT